MILLFLLTLVFGVPMIWIGLVYIFSRAHWLHVVSGFLDIAVGVGMVLALWRESLPFAIPWDPDDFFSIIGLTLSLHMLVVLILQKRAADSPPSTGQETPVAGDSR